MKQILLKTWLIVVCLLMGAGTMWGATITLTFDNLGKLVTQTLNTKLSTFTSGDYTFNYLQGRTQNNAILLAKGTGAFIANKTAMPGDIKSVTVYINSGASAKTTYHCAFTTSACTEAITTGSTAVNIADGNSNKYTCSTTGAKYFCVSLGNANNGQVLKLEVEYEDNGGTTPTKLGTPSNLSATNVTATSATLSWDAVTNASSYELTVLDDKAEFVKEAQSVSGTSYNLTGLTASTTYTWSVKAIGNGSSYSDGDESNEVDFTTLAQGDGAETITTISADKDADIKFITGSSSSTGAFWVNSTPLTANNITLSGSNGTSSSYSYYDGSVVRFYQNNSFTITPSNGATITKIEIVRQSTTSSNSATINCSGLTASRSNTTTNTNVYTGSATSAVTFTNTAQARFTKILVYTTGGSSKTTPDLKFSPATYNVTFGETFTAPTLTNPQNVPVTYSVSDVTPANCIEVAENGTVTINAAGSATITAFYDGSKSDTYNSNTASYQLVVAPAALSTIDAIYTKAKEIGETAADVRVKFNNWVVSGAYSSYTYLTDGSKGLIIYGASTGFSAGDVLSGTVNCQLNLYNGAANIRNLTTTTVGLTVNKGGSVEPVTIATSELSGAHSGVLLKYTDMTYDASAKTLSDGTNTITPYTSLYDYGTTFVDGKKYDVTGVYTLFYVQNKNEILPRSAEDIVLVEVLNKYIVNIETPVNGTLTVKAGETVVNDGDEVAEGTTLTIECTPTDAENYRYKNWQYKEGDEAWATRTKDFSYTMPSANVHFKANFEQIPIYTVTYMSLGSPAGTEQVKEGNKIANAPSVSLADWTFVGWTTNGSYTDSETAPALFDDAITEATTLYAVFSQGENGAAGSASLTNDEICDNVGGSYADGSITNTYGTWNYNAAKQGNVSKDGEYFLQLRKNNEPISYLQIPEMAGNITSIVLGRVCNTSKAKYTGSIYFRSEKSNDATAIATATQSTALTDVTLTIPDGYKTGYVMVSGACRIESVTVNYTTGGTKTYTITGPLPDGGTINFVATNGDGKYYATFCSDRAIKFDETFINDAETCMASIKAYAIAIVDGEICRTDLYDNNNDGNYTYVPTHTGVLFEYVLTDGVFDGAVPYEYADAEAYWLNTVEDNMLRPASVEKETDGSYLFYKLAYGDWENKKNLGFWWGEENGKPFVSREGGVYLAVPVEAGGASNVRGFSFDIEGTITSIESANNDAVTGEIYNLQGQRINRLQQGVNIVNGHKVIR